MLSGVRGILVALRRAGIPISTQSFLDGITDVGWHGDVEQVRRAFAASVAIRSGHTLVEVLLLERVHETATTTAFETD